MANGLGSFDPNIVSRGLQTGLGIAGDIRQAGRERLGGQQERDTARLQSLVQGAQQLKLIPSARKAEFLQQRISQLQDAGIPTTETEEALTLVQQGRFDELEQFTDQIIAAGQQQPAGFTLSPGQQRFTAGGEVVAEVAPKAVEQATPAKLQEFRELTEGLTGEDLDSARRISLGLESAAPKIFQSSAKTFNIGGVPHILDAEGNVRKITVDGESITTEVVAKSKAEIAQRVKFETLTGASRAKTIDEGFEKIEKINLGILNIDKAINAVKAGAGVGAIESRFPSLRAASVELDNIQKRMALDVVGATTFGALSKGELDLSKEVALPTKLDTNELIDHLQRKKIAQEKLRAYFNEQIQFLDQGGTVAGFLRKKKSEIATTVNDLSPEEQAELAELERQFGGQ